MKFYFFKCILRLPRFTSNSMVTEKPQSDSSSAGGQVQKELMFYCKVIAILLTVLFFYVFIILPASCCFFKCWMSNEAVASYIVTRGGTNCISCWFFCCHNKVLNWAILENIRPVEQVQYRENQYAEKLGAARSHGGWEPRHNSQCAALGFSAYFKYCLAFLRE